MDALREKIRARQRTGYEPVVDSQSQPFATEDHIRLLREKGELETRLAEVQEQLNAERRTVAERDAELGIAVKAYAELEDRNIILSEELRDAQMATENVVNDRDLLSAQLSKAHAELETERLRFETLFWESQRKEEDLNAEIDLCSGTIQALTSAHVIYRPKLLPLRNEPGLSSEFLEKFDEEIDYIMTGWGFIRHLCDTGIYSMRGRRVELDDNGPVGEFVVQVRMREIDVEAPPPMQELLRKELQSITLRPENSRRHIAALERCLKSDVYDRLDAELAEAEKREFDQYQQQNQKRSAEEHESESDPKKSKLSDKDFDDMSVESSDTLIGDDEEDDDEEDDDEDDEDGYTTDRENELIHDQKEASYEAFLGEVCPCDSYDNAEMDDYDRVSANDEAENPHTDVGRFDRGGYGDPEILRQWLGDCTAQLPNGYDYNSSFGEQEVKEELGMSRHEWLA